MSRFGSSATAKAGMDVYTAMSAIAMLVLALGATWLVLHNMEHGSTSEGQQAATPFEILSN
ncbi:MAG: hypothetical protein MK074_03115 [Phycisphaerales bacterium]|nr:hypothetical protein [Phycisphaerales bacterium]